MPARATKTCSTCGKSKPTAQFGKYSKNADGLHRQCKACLGPIAEAWKLKNADVIDWHRAKASVIRQHGREGATPERITARVEAIRLERIHWERRKAEKPPPPVVVPPRNAISRHVLMEKCGILDACLHDHMKRNTEGIRDAHFKHPQPGKAAAAVYDIKKAAPFIALMQSKLRFRRNIKGGGTAS